jgi:hypothetical protein
MCDMLVLLRATRGQRIMQQRSIQRQHPPVQIWQVGAPGQTAAA